MVEYVLIHVVNSMLILTDSILIEICLASIVLSDRALTQPNSSRNSGQIVFGKQSILHFLLRPVQKKEQGKK